MCKKSLRTAIDLHKRLVSNGFYGELTGDDRKALFSSKLLELEPNLKPCPFCGELPVFDRGCLSHYGMTSGGGGWSANITCEECGLEFKGVFGVDVVEQWNGRV